MEHLLNFYTTMEQTKNQMMKVAITDYKILFENVPVPDTNSECRTIGETSMSNKLSVSGTIQ